MGGRRKGREGRERGEEREGKLPVVTLRIEAFATESHVAKKTLWQKLNPDFVGVAKGMTKLK